MIFPAITSVYAGLLGLVLVALSGWVSAGRVQADVLIGDGDDRLKRRIRAHGNFTEFVPLALLIIALLEAGGASHGLVQGLGLALLVGRLLHPVGMLAAKNTPQQFIFRGGGVIATYGVVAIASIALLVRAL